MRYWMSIINPHNLQKLRIKQMRKGCTEFLKKINSLYLAAAKHLWSWLCSKAGLLYGWVGYVKVVVGHLEVFYICPPQYTILQFAYITAAGHINCQSLPFHEKVEDICLNTFCHLHFVPSGMWCRSIFIYKNLSSCFLLFFSTSVS